METTGMNLMEGLLKEMNRAREVKALYDEIPQGAFGSRMIQISIETAERAISLNDIGLMASAYKALKEIE